MKADSDCGVNTTGGSPLHPESCFDTICTVAAFRLALRVLRRNYGRPGPDGETVRDITRHFAGLVQQVIGSLLDGTYSPSPPQHFALSSGQKRRVIALYNVRDRLVQQAVRVVLYPLVDARLGPNIFGYRRGRSSLQLINYVRERAQEHVLRLDVRSCFESVDRRAMLTSVANVTGQDARTVALLKQLIFDRSLPGLPPGNVLSPMLLNLYFEPFDRQMGLSYCRFADDLYIFLRCCSDAAGAEHTARTRLATLGFQVNDNKTEVIRGAEIAAAICRNH